MRSIHASSPSRADVRMLRDIQASRLLELTNSLDSSIDLSDCEMFHGGSEALSLRILHVQLQPEIDALACNASAEGQAILRLFRTDIQ